MKAPMREYESFVYLDVPKTGSTFIDRLLKRFGTEKLVVKKPHLPVGDRYDPRKFHFISVRDPLDQYVSLYSYGSEKKGGLYERLRAKKLDHLYDGSWSGFKPWLNFVLDPENARLVDPAYGAAGKGEGCKAIGLQSYRFLSLAVPHVKELLRPPATRTSILERYHSRNIASFTIRHESFRSDLKKLLLTRLGSSIADLNGAVRFVETSPPINASERPGGEQKRLKIGGRRGNRLREREWLLHELFGY